MDNKKETISGYVDKSTADAVKAAALENGQKPSTWVATAIEQRLEREGLIPSVIADLKALSDEALAVAEIASAAEVLAALKRVRASAAKARALSC